MTYISDFVKQKSLSAHRFGNVGRIAKHGIQDARVFRPGRPHEAGRRDEESLFENCPNYNLSANRKGKANFFISLARNPLKSPGSGK